MKTLNLTLKNAKNLSPTILIDDKPVKLKKNAFKAYTTQYQTEKNEVSIVIQKYQELSGKLWFLMSILFFIISVFGIFDIRMGKRSTVINSKFNVKLENDITNFNATINDIDGYKGVIYNCNGVVEEVVNTCFEDEVVKKRKKVLLATKILLWIALIAVVVCLVVTKNV